MSSKHKQARMQRKLKRKAKAKRNRVLLSALDVQPRQTIVAPSFLPRAADFEQTFIPAERGESDAPRAIAKAVCARLNPETPTSGDAHTFQLTAPAASGIEGHPLNIGSDMAREYISPTPEQMKAGVLEDVRANSKGFVFEDEDVDEFHKDAGSILRQSRVGKARYKYMHIAMPRTFNSLRAYRDLKKKVTTEGPSHILNSTRDSYSVAFPKWLVRMLPYKQYGMHFVNAAIIGAQCEGTEIKLGQASMMNPAGVKKGDKLYGSKTIRVTFTPSERGELALFGHGVGSMNSQTVVRTAAFLGFGIPGTKDGIINPPWEYDSKWKHEPFSRRHLEVLGLATGFMSRKLFESEGIALYDELVALANELEGYGFEEEKLRWTLMMEWCRLTRVQADGIPGPWHTDTEWKKAGNLIRRVVDAHRHNVSVAILLRRAQLQRMNAKASARKFYEAAQSRAGA